MGDDDTRGEGGGGGGGLNVSDRIGTAGAADDARPIII